MTAVGRTGTRHLHQAPSRQANENKPSQTNADDQADFAPLNRSRLFDRSSCCPAYRLGLRRLILLRFRHCSSDRPLLKRWRRLPFPRFEDPGCRTQRVVKAGVELFFAVEGVVFVEDLAINRARRREFRVGAVGLPNHDSFAALGAAAQLADMARSNPNLRCAMRTANLPRHLTTSTTAVEHPEPNVFTTFQVKIDRMALAPICYDCSKPIREMPIFWLQKQGPGQWVASNFPDWSLRLRFENLAPAPPSTKARPASVSEPGSGTDGQGSGSQS